MNEVLIVLVPLLPLLASTWIGIGMLLGFNRGESGERHTSRVALLSTGLSLLLLIVIDVQAITNEITQHQIIARWFNSGDLYFNISFIMDRLSLSFATLISLIGLLSLRFAVNYLHREKGYQRFFMVMTLFISAMLLIVLAGNAMLTFVGWEMAGVSSYLLIGYVFNRDTATDNANRAFVTNRIGDAGMVLGIFVAFSLIGTLEWPSLTKQAVHLPTLQTDLLLLGFVIAALAKSAVIPFSAWISRALEGPTPSSAIFYGALMVHAGVYLLLRIAPILEHAPMVQFVLIALGILTALYGFLGGLVQTDVKTAFIFSTTGQIGLMVISCGLGWFELASWHLLAHASWRAGQFLHAPAFMYMINRPARPVPVWLQNKPVLYTAALQRFWLDNITDSLLVRPVQQIAYELQEFDQKVVNRIVGLPAQVGAVSSLAEPNQQNRTDHLTRGQGVLGHIMQTIAGALHRFEEQLVLKGSGEGLIKSLHHVGSYLLRIDQLLTQPRYLWLMILATFVVII